MSKWQGKSDFEINKAAFLLAAKAGLVKFEDLMEKQNPNRNGVMYGDGTNWHEWDGCNKASDAWPIIVGSQISIFNSDNDLWTAQKWVNNKRIAHGFVRGLKVLRAAMIVYLEMNEINSK